MLKLEIHSNFPSRIPDLSTWLSWGCGGVGGVGSTPLAVIVYQMVPATREKLPPQGSHSCMKRCRKTGFQHKLPATQATCYYMESLQKGLSTAQPAWEGVLCGKIFMTWMVHVTGHIRQIQVLSTYIIHTEMLQNTVLGYLGPVSRRPRKVFAPGKQEQNLTRYDYRAVLFTYS